MKITYRFDKKTKTEIIETDEKTDVFINKIVDKIETKEVISGILKIIKEAKKI